ncbi:MAG TPA: LPS export ABC transporter permease LptF [Rhizomicrobium sp.]|nr:LPS export ABC transporter permease LptF [Rhizomicrobium sp.]
MEQPTPKTRPETGSDVSRERAPNTGLKPSRLSLYVLGQLLGPVALLTLLLTSVVWLVSSLQFLDLVINRGQSALTFLYLILLVLPSLLAIILPIAFFFATLTTLQRLQGDSELVVMASAGYSLRQLAVPVLGCAAIVMVLTYACLLYLSPAGQRTLRDKVLDIRADMAGALLNEGDFNTSQQGLTIFIRQLSNRGEIRGILVHDNRDRARPVTYIAEKGILAQTPAGTRLIMLDGTIETSSQAGKQLQVLHFESDTVNLDQFSGPTRYTLRKIPERHLDELFWPPEKQGLTQRIRDQFFAEAHNRIAQPLYCIAFALIALAAVTRGRRQRGSIAARLTGASLIAAGLRIASYGVMGLAQRNPGLVALFYLLPALGVAGAIAVLAGYTPVSLMARLRPNAMIGSGA